MFEATNSPCGVDQAATTWGTPFSIPGWYLFHASVYMLHLKIFCDAIVFPSTVFLLWAKAEGFY